MPIRKPRTKKQKKHAVKQVMEEFKSGELNVGKSKKKVKNKKQAIAIAMSTAGIKKSKKKK